MIRLSFTTLFACILWFLPLSSFANTYTPLYDFPSKMSSEEMMQATNVAVLGRGWTVVELTESRLIAKIDHRGVKANLTLSLENRQLSYYCTGTRKKEVRKRAGLKYKMVMETSDFIPVKWIANIRKDIDRYLPNN